MFRFHKTFYLNQYTNSFCPRMGVRVFDLPLELSVAPGHEELLIHKRTHNS